MADEKKCPFCGEKPRQPRYVQGMAVLDRQGNPIFDYCCLAYKTNEQYKKHQIRPDTAAKMGVKLVDPNEDI